MGKPVSADLRLGLVTLPTLIFLESHSSDPRLRLLQNGERLGEAEIDSLLDDIRASGAVSSAREEAEQHIQNALDALVNLPDSDERIALAELAEYVVGRLH
jgi:geranylgeranyl pyrophosphate synthase